MKNIKSGILALTFLFSTAVFAGNDDRAGEAGASELLINPWAGSSGWGGANTASAQGIEAMNLNVAGLAYSSQTEVKFANSSYLSGTGIKINSLGFAQRVGESGGVLGVSVMSMGFGDLDVTTSNDPDGGLGTFKPNYLNIGLAYSKKFSNTISGGLVVKVINQSIASVSASGVAVDAGVNYVTGKRKHLKFGIAIRNVGPTAKYSGNGLSERFQDPSSGKQLTISQRSSDFELPSLVNIGLSYDFYLGRGPEAAEEDLSDHRLTLAGNFTSNSFTKDQIRGGLEYAFKEMFMVRGGYIYESKAASLEDSKTANRGLSFGASIAYPLTETTKIGLDYSYQVTHVFGGTNIIGVNLNF